MNDKIKFMRHVHHSILLLICLTVLFASFVAAQNKEPRNLFVIKVNDKKGFIDKTGKIMIEPRFDQVQNFTGGIARVWMNCRPCERRFIDKQGNFIRNEIFDEGPQLEFAEGLAAVRIGRIVEGRYGFIDNKGNIRIQPQYKSTFRFSDGLAKVMVENNLQGYIDKSGKMVIEPQFENAYDFYEGMAQIKVDEKIGFIDKTGKVVISPQFTEAGDFSEGLASVKIGELWGFIDKKGNIVIKPQYQDAYEFSEGLSYIQKGKKYGFIDKSGNIKIKFLFDEAGNFSEGLAWVKLKGKFQFIDKSGNFAFTQKFDDANSFNGGLAEVSIGKSTYKGTITRDNIGKIDNGIKSGYIDKTGKFIWINK